MTPTNTSAWDEYWSGPGKSASTGCLPFGSQALHLTQNRIWSAFSQSLHRKAFVLDLATGDGAVLIMLHKERPDLKLLGVDSAAKLPPSPKAIKLRSRVSLDKLPIASSSVDAVTSRFGFEYADSEQSVIEIARVLRRNGSVLLMLHHSDGPILRSSLHRLAALDWILIEQKVIQKALAFIANPMTRLMAVPRSFSDIIIDAEKLFQNRTAPVDLLQAVVAILQASRNGDIATAKATLLEVKRQADRECQRLQNLQHASCDTQRIEKYEHWFGKAGFKTEIATHDDGNEKSPFCWTIRARFRD